MKIAILSRNKSLYSTKSLVKAALEHGHSAQIIDAMHCTLQITPHKPSLSISYHGELLPKFDAIIPRVGGSISSYTLSVLRQFEMMGVYCLNTAAAMAQARDKLQTLQLLAQHGIRVPHTCYTHHAKYFADVIHQVGEAPLVIKPLKGSQGTGVILAENNTNAQTMLESLKSLRGNFLVQKYVAEAKGADIRCFVVDGHVVASMKRQAANGEFRSNLHLGGVASNIRLSKEEEQIAIKVSKIMNLKVCGIDILQSNEGAVVLEVNSTPGLEGIEKTTGVNVSNLIISNLTKHFYDTDGFKNEN